MLSGRGKFTDPYLTRRFTKKKENGNESKVYYVSHYGTPRRTVKMKPPAVQRVASVTNVTSSGALVPTSNLKCSRSLSLQDMSTGFQTSLSQRRSQMCCMGGGMQNIAVEELGSERTRAIALRVYSKLLKNVWRRCREQAGEKEAAVSLATAQVTHLKIQMSVLKTLLKSDEQTISGSFREISTLRSLLSKLQEEYDKCKKEREEAREATESVRAELHQARTETFNDKNSLMLARSEAAALEAQLEREREKIAKLKTENRALLEKVDKYSMNLKNKTEKISRLSENVDQLEKQISSYTQLLRSSEIKIDEDQRALEDWSNRVRGLKKELGDALGREGRLRAQLDESAAKARDQTNTYNKTIKEHVMELVRLEAELAMREAVPLGVRILKTATTALNLPLLFVTALALMKELNISETPA